MGRGSEHGSCLGKSRYNLPGEEQAEWSAHHRRYTVNLKDIFSDCTVFHTDKNSCKMTAERGTSSLKSIDPFNFFKPPLGRKEID